MTIIFPVWVEELGDIAGAAVVIGEELGGAAPVTIEVPSSVVDRVTVLGPTAAFWTAAACWVKKVKAACSCAGVRLAGYVVTAAGVVVIASWSRARCDSLRSA